MFQLSWPELIILLFSAIVCGAVIYSFIFPVQKMNEAIQPNLDEELIGTEAKSRLRNYDLEENITDLQGKYNDQLLQLKNQIKNLEEQVLNLTSLSSEKSTVVHPSLIPVSEEALYEENHIDENREEDDYMQAKEELELALFKAKRQLARYQTALQNNSNQASEIPTRGLNEEQFRNELEKSMQLIEQLYLSFQKNPHTSYSLQQMKNRVTKEMATLTTLEQRLHPSQS